jgi:hypothetical protein
MTPRVAARNASTSWASILKPRFLPERRREPVGKVDRAYSPPPARAALEARRQSIDDVQIPRHDCVDPRPSNLHDDPLTGVEHGSVHLRGRGGRE